ncbi:unnamed protein product [Mytilus edulis]|uniref:Uncharacterized protein n=1 Tax=Mytilus edulis TaxID=6550 RepID=A0A8S3PZN9_MYTED|nr:unnamed protein product [Mytilus edulis]
MLPFVVFQFHLIFVLVSGSHGEKRLLLNDPDYAARIQQLEVTVQTLVSEMTSVKQQKVTTESKLLEANTKISQLQSALNSRTRTEWSCLHKMGKKTCPQNNGTELIYSGMMGGGWHDRASSPAEPICLPHDPDFVAKDTATNDLKWISSLYGAEYEETFGGLSSHDDDVPCAVCHATHSASVIMIPGKTSCYTGWKTEYFGRMSAGANYNKASSQYTCIDEKSDVLEAGSENKNGYLLYAVRAVCGSLKCPPYHENALLTCVRVLSTYHGESKLALKTTAQNYYIQQRPFVFHDPDFVTKDSANTDPKWVSSLYGAEYDSVTGPYNHDVHCAVCCATHSSSVIMIPGKTSCYTGWKTEYFGRMSASANYHKASSQYTCIDENPDVLEAGVEDKNGYLIFAVIAVCGSLRCPPFYDTALLTCVVCSS